MKRAYRETLIDAHRTIPSSCWFCGKALGPVFWTVKKRGVDVRVHPTCRHEAGELVLGLPLG